MFINYLKITLRIISRNKVFSAINIAGLALGIASTLIIGLWVLNELNFDKFHEKADRIYRLTPHIYFGGDVVLALTPAPMAKWVNEKYDEIEDYARIGSVGEHYITYNNINHQEKKCIYADKGLFKIFTFPLVQGHPDTVFKDDFSAVITESTAKKYFGDTPALGKKILIDNRFPVNISGVVKDVPENSQLQFDIVFPFSLLDVIFNRQTDDWNTYNYYSYILIEEGKEAIVADSVKNIYKNIVNENSGEVLLQPLTDIHLRSNCIIDYKSNGDIKYVYIFMAIALIILMIACINFINLSTARSGTRAREVGVRKATGATKNTLVYQFIGESFFLSLISHILALVIIELFVPYFNDKAGVKILVDFQSPLFYFLLSGTFAITGIFAGIYPAFFMSSASVTSIMKGSIFSENQNSYLRWALVISQFTIAIALIVSVFVINSQLKYIKNKKLGLNTKNIIYSTLKGKQVEEAALLKQKIKQSSGVISASLTSNFPLSSPNATSWSKDSSDIEPVRLNFTDVDYDFIETFQLELSNGRGFNKNETNDRNDFIINKSALHEMKLKHGVGDTILFHAKEGEIVGIVEDYHFMGLQKKIQPMLLRISDSTFQYIFIHVKPEKFESAISKIEAIFHEIDPFYAFKYNSLTKDYQSFYKHEERTADLLYYFSVIAIVISCMGLFGLVAFNTQQRKKEIGIRKTIGSELKHVLFILSKDFIKIILYATLFAVPIAWLAMKLWLDGFAYHIEIHWKDFAYAILLAVIITFLTIGYHTIKTARTDPCDVLRYE